jgi:hypothetical protein
VPLLRRCALSRAAARDGRVAQPAPREPSGLTQFQQELRASATAAVHAEVLATAVASEADRQRLAVLDEVLLPAAEERFTAGTAELTAAVEEWARLPVSSNPAGLPDDLLAERTAGRRHRRTTPVRAAVAAASTVLEELQVERAHVAARLGTREERARARIRTVVARANREDAYYRVRLVRRHPHGSALADRWPAELLALPEWAGLGNGLLRGAAQAGEQS